MHRVTQLKILLATACVLLLATPMAQADPRSDCPGADATFTGSNADALRTTVICLTNRERVARGMAALGSESHLTTAAQGHSEDMAENNYFDHTDLSGGKPWDRTKAAGYSNGWVGENIAAGYRSPYALVLGWMKSEGHCENILNSPYVDIGIGVATAAGSKYGTYWTMVLGGHNSSAPTVGVSCPYPGLTDGAVLTAKPSAPDINAPTAPKLSSVKRQSDGRYKIKGSIAPASKGTRVKLTVKRGKKSRTYSVKTDASGNFSKIVRAPRGSGKVRVTAKLWT